LNGTGDCVVSLLLPISSVLLLTVTTKVHSKNTSCLWETADWG
jgi:hypothetical protein